MFSSVVIVVFVIGLWFVAICCLAVLALVFRDFLWFRLVLVVCGLLGVAWCFILACWFGCCFIVDWFGL